MRRYVSNYMKLLQQREGQEDFTTGLIKKGCVLNKVYTIEVKIL